MSEQLNESVSALIDGELSELELRSTLQNLSDEQRHQWQRHQIARTAMHGGSTAFAAIDLSARIQAEINQEPALAAMPTAGNKPFARFAVAASVALSVMGGAWMYQTAGVDNPSAPLVAQHNSPVAAPSIVNSLGVQPQLVSTGSSQHTATKPHVLVDVQRINANKQAAERLDAYLSRHVEQAAFDGGNGLLPYARVRVEGKEF